MVKKRHELRDSPNARRIIADIEAAKKAENSKGGKGMKVSDVYRSKFIAAGDLNGKTVKVTITGCGTHTFEGQNGKEDDVKIVLDLKEFDRPFIAVRTNTSIISDILKTEELDEWVGKTIYLRSQKVDSPRGIVDSIRVQYPAAGEVAG